MANTKKPDTKQAAAKPAAKAAPKTPVAAVKEAAKKPAPKAEKPKAPAAKPAAKTRTVEKVFDTKTVKKANKPTITTETLSRNFQEQIHKTFS